MKKTFSFACGVAGLACTSVAQTHLLSVEELATIEPVSMARAVALPDGSVVRVGEWTPYQGSHTREERQLVFDAYTQEGTCGIQSYRIRSADFCNVFVTNDMNLGANTDLGRGLDSVSFAWYWYCDGFGTEDCLVGVFTQDSVPCDADSFDYVGWIFDFGTLSCNAGGYYISTIDLSADAWPTPTGGTGSYRFVYGQGFTNDGNFELATCAQPILFATGDDRGDPDAPGTQGPYQFDDLNTDGVHTSDECQDYSSPVCPYEYGPLVAWRQIVDCRSADFNDDGSTDTQDFLAFLTAWAAEDSSADCDTSGDIDTQDFLCFLNIWSSCV